jgi:DNA-binding NtrC family response regulator
LGLVPPQIAVVDDDEDTVNLFTEIINMDGYNVIGFQNPQSLIDYLCEHLEELKFILIDYKMPQMTGCELANQIHKLNPSIQMVFVTAYIDIINNALNMEIFKKPLPIHKIIDIVDKYMHHEVIT